MIKANELRIGNLVNANYKNLNYPGGEVVVEAILPDGINITMGDSEVYQFEELNGIPITAEWLERLGFEKGKNEDGDDCMKKTAKGRVTFLLVEHGFSDSDEVDYATFFESNVGMGECMVVLNPPRHVHELQNLFYAMTGEELTIKHHAL